MKKVPDIRFKGFCEDWKRCKFSDLVLIERGGSPRPIDYYITDAPDGLNWVKIGDAPAQGRYITKTAEKIKPEGLSKTRQVQPGDLILSNSMSFGKPYIMAINGCIHDGWLLIRDIQSQFDLKFLCHMLGIDQMLDQYSMFAAGSTVSNLNKELVGNTIVSLPTIKEQQVIGEYLESMDTLITFYQRKSEKLKLFKESMLDKMFPKNGEKVPEIRLEGFSGDWEKRKLGEIVQITMGQSPDGSTYSDTPSDYILVQGNADLRNGWVVPRVWTTQSTKRTYAGDIIMSVRAPAGAVGKTSYNAVIGRGVAAIKGNEFIYQTLVKMDLEGYWKKLSAGSTFESLSSDSIFNSEIFVPTAKEQEQIGVYFQTIDTLISFHQRKLEKLKQFKKSMLNKMFI